MDIVVCVKRVPDTAQTDILRIASSEKDIDKSGLVYKMNDWDEYALETAVQLKEKFGGTITALTIGTADWDDILRRSLAMGADSAIRIDYDIAPEDPYVVAKVLKILIQRLRYDLVLFGAQSEDFGSGQLGVMVAEILDIPHSTLVVELAVEEKQIHVKKELEGGMLESYIITLPALLTIQTGINQPRYISMAGIRRAMRKELEVKSLEDLGLSPQDLRPMVTLEKLELPSREGEAEFITGTAEEVAGQVVKMLKDSGIF